MKSYEKRFSSQNGEDGVIARILGEIGMTNRVAVEFGVGAAEANTLHLLRQGWSAFWFDSDPVAPIHPRCSFRQVTLTPENIREQDIPREFDVLSIDVDGNDYHLRQALADYHPRVCVMEYNGWVPPEVRYVMPYDPNYRWQYTRRGPVDTRYGASLLSITEQADALGYDLVYCESRGINAFFVRRDVNRVPVVACQDAWIPIRTRSR